MDFPNRYQLLKFYDKVGFKTAAPQQIWQFSSQLLEARRWNPACAEGRAPRRLRPSSATLILITGRVRQRQPADDFSEGGVPMYGYSGRMSARRGRYPFPMRRAASAEKEW
jgi:hypothetical protein